jgi:hypothetical protein
MDDAHNQPDTASDGGQGSNPPRKPREVRGKWDFKDARGAMRVSPRRTCPVCGGDTNCQISAEHPGVVGARAVLCRRRFEAPEFDLGVRLAGADGVVREAGRKSAGGRLWEPIGSDGRVVRAPVKSAEQAAAEEVDDAERDEAKRQLAEQEYLRACGGSTAELRGVDHPMVRDYLKARGIDPAWFPGGVLPKCLRFDDRCPVYYDFERGGGWGSRHPLKVVTRPAGNGRPAMTAGRTLADVPEPSRSPAMVAAVISKHDKPRLIRGVHATYLVRGEDGSVRKNEERIQGGRREFAPCDGVVVVGAGSEGMSAASMFPSGVAIAGEGFETTLSAYVACGCFHTGLVCAHTTGLKKLPATLASMEPQSRQLHTLVLLVDLDKLRASDGAISRTGQRVCPKVAADVAKACPWISVHMAVIRAKHWKELARRVQLSGEDLAAVIKDPGKLGCGVERIIPIAAAFGGSGVSWEEDQPIDPAKGVDWNDVLKLVVAEWGAPDERFTVGRAIMEGVDLKANEAISRAWWEANPNGPVSVASSSPGPHEGLPSHEGDTGATGGGQSPPPGGKGSVASGGGSGGGGGNAAAIEGSDDDEQGQLPETDLGRARMFLWQTAAPREGDRAGAVYEFKYVDGEWKRWAGNVWRRMRGKGEVLPIRGMVREWMTGKYTWKTRSVKGTDGEKKTERYKEYVNPSLKAVEAVAKCVLDEVRVETEESRFWMPPDFNPIGEPIVGRRPWQRFIDRPGKHHPPLPDPRDLIALDNCLLDSRAIEAGRFVSLGHDSRLFNEHVLPYGLPVADVRAAVEGGNGETAAAIQAIDELANEHCPNALDFLNDVFLAEEDPQGAAEQIWELRKLIWYYCTYYTGCKEANIAILLGPDNAGKGTAMDLIKGVVGEGNYVTSTVDEAADKNHITSWRGRRVAMVSEAESGERADLRRCMNFWKRVSGGDEVATRKLYQEEDPNTKLPTRILVSANEMPDMKDRTGALLSRMIAFAFKQSHTGKTTYDRGRKDRVISEAPGVFIWAIGGGLEVGRLKREGRQVFSQPRAGEGALASYRGYQSDLPEFIAQWLRIVPDPEADEKTVLFSRDMWEAYVVYRRLADDTHPERGGPATLTKAIQTLLWKAGWRGEIDEHRPVIDPRTNERRRMAVYTHLQLTELARANIAAVQSKGTTYAPGGNDSMIPFGD